MKTKQEQIEEIQKIINDCYVVDSFIAAEGSEGGYIDTKEAAKALIENGYGDVSEYKAEIERLKATLGQCNTELNSALESLKSQCREIGALKAGTKQAKIDVLNRLKEIYGYYSCYSLGNDVRSLNVIIDELIKEVENEQKD